MWAKDRDHPLRRMFAGLTEQTFVEILGIGDPNLVDYLSALLSRFIHMDAIYRLSNAQGRRLEEVADMMLEAESLPPEGRTRRRLRVSRCGTGALCADACGLGRLGRGVDARPARRAGGPFVSRQGAAAAGTDRKRCPVRRVMNPSPRPGVFRSWHSATKNDSSGN